MATLIAVECAAQHEVAMQINNVLLEADDSITIRTPKGHNIFIVFEEGELTISNEAMRGDNKETQVIYVAEHGWHIPRYTIAKAG